MQSAGLRKQNSNRLQFVKYWSIGNICHAFQQANHWSAFVDDDGVVTPNLLIWPVWQRARRDLNQNFNRFLINYVNSKPESIQNSITELID